MDRILTIPNPDPAPLPLTPTSKTHRLARLSVAIVLGQWEELRLLRRDAPAGEPDRAWREAVLQSHLFAGFPRVVEACGFLAAEGGLGATDQDEIESGNEDDALARGQAIFDQIYADQSGPVLGVMQGYHPQLPAWVVGHAYGKVLGRPGLKLETRELLAVASLAALGQDRQLASHVRGALRSGANALDLNGVLAAVAGQLPEDDLRRAERVVRRFAMDHTRDSEQPPPRG